MNTTLYAMDLAKQVFQVYWVDGQGVMHEKRLKRGQVLEFFRRVERASVAMEACGSAHHWGRELGALGHEVQLVHASYVRAFVKTNKSDRADAQAIWTAARQPGTRFVPVKTVEQQSVLALHAVREHRKRVRTAMMNQLRGLLSEFGVVLKPGRRAALKELAERFGELQGTLPAVMIELVRDQCESVRGIDEQMARIDQQIQAQHLGDEQFLRLKGIPGIGWLGASALVAKVGDARQFGAGRHASAFVGLVPRHQGTGGHVRLGHISKRGDVYLRTLLIHGARAVIAHPKLHSPWLKGLLARRPRSVAAVALANKNMRIAWALLRRGEQYEREHQCVGA